MRPTLVIVIAALLAGALGLAAGRWWFAPERRPEQPVPAEVQVLDIGERRPDTALADLDGTMRPLAEHDGAPVILNFWATWCPPCVRELPLLADWHDRRDADGLAVLAIALETEAEPVADFMTAHGLDLPVRLAAPGRIDLSTTFGNTRGVLPYSVLLGADGRVLAQKLGELKDSDLQAWAELARGEDGLAR
ncbi:MAG: TlpA disulfide reductase family protein [Lysobacteraceae bacterium]